MLCLKAGLTTPEKYWVTFFILEIRWENMLRSKLFGPFLYWVLRKQVRALNFCARFISLCKDDSFQEVE